MKNKIHKQFHYKIKINISVVKAHLRSRSGTKRNSIGSTQTPKDSLREEPWSSLDTQVRSAKGTNYKGMGHDWVHHAYKTLFLIFLRQGLSAALAGLHPIKNYSPLPPPLPPERWKYCPSLKAGTLNMIDIRSLTALVENVCLQPQHWLGKGKRWGVEGHFWLNSEFDATLGTWESHPWHWTGRDLESADHVSRFADELCHVSQVLWKTAEERNVEDEDNGNLKLMTAKAG